MAVAPTIPITTGTFTYTRTFPVTASGDTSDTLSDVVPTPTDPANQERGIELEFTPQPDTVDPYKLFFPSVAALRYPGGSQLKGFNTPGDRTTGGGGEVRMYAPLPPNPSDPTAPPVYAATGTLVPVNVAYAQGFGPENLAENPSGKIRIVLTPIAPASAGALWKVGWKIVDDFSKVFITDSISYA